LSAEAFLPVRATLCCARRHLQTGVIASTTLISLAPNG